MKLKDLKKIIKEEIQALRETENELGHSQGRCPDGMWYSPPSYDIPGWEEGYCYTMLDGVTLTGMGVEGGGTLPSIGKAPINKGNTSRMRNKMNRGRVQQKRR